MNKWYTCKVKYNRYDDEGRFKTVTEPYLVDAVSFTEAESRIYEKVGDLVDGDFFVTTINKSNISDIFHFDDTDKWYATKVKYISVDDESGKEKKITSNMLVAATNVKDAYEKIEEGLSTMLVPYDITSIVESPIIDIFPFESSEDSAEEEEEEIDPYISDEPVSAAVEEEEIEEEEIEEEVVKEEENEI